MIWVVRVQLQYADTAGKSRTCTKTGVDGCLALRRRFIIYDKNTRSGWRKLCTRGEPTVGGCYGRRGGDRWKPRVSVSCLVPASPFLSLPATSGADNTPCVVIRSRASHRQSRKLSALMFRFPRSKRSPDPSGGIEISRLATLNGGWQPIVDPRQ